MSKMTRNVIIAVVLLIVLLVEPFWGPIKSAITGEEAQTGASVDVPRVTCTVSAVCAVDFETGAIILPAGSLVLDATEMEVPEGTPVTEVLGWAAEKNECTVVVTDNGVQRIGNVENGDSCVWTCMVNGKAAAVDTEKPGVQEGDQILFTFLMENG